MNTDNQIKIKDALKSPQYKIVLFRESFVQSVCADAVTVGMLVFCIWFSSGDKFWTFMCMLMLVSYLFTRVATKQGTIISTKRELLEYVDEVQREKGGIQ